MIHQRPSSNHTRDRDIANMPLEPVYAEEHWIVSLSLWAGIIALVALLVFAAHIYIESQALANAV